MLQTDIALTIEIILEVTGELVVDINLEVFAAAFNAVLVPPLHIEGLAIEMGHHIVAALAKDTLLENIYANLEASPYGDAMVAKDGAVMVPQGPGLGVEPDMDIVAKYREGAIVRVT